MSAGPEIACIYNWRQAINTNCNGKLFLTNVSIFLDNFLTLELYKKNGK
jgi:hypothetical protein